MNFNSVISSSDSTLSNLDAVRHNWRWVLASGLAFASLGAMAFSYSVLMTLASVFVLGWALVFGGFFQAIHACKVSQWNGFLLELLLVILYVVVGLVMVSHPEAGAMSLTLLIGAFFLVGGLFRIFAGTMLHPLVVGMIALERGRHLSLGYSDLGGMACLWPVGDRYVCRDRYGLQHQLAHHARRECPQPSVSRQSWTSDSAAEHDLRRTTESAMRGHLRNSEDALMGWRERERVSFCITIYEKSGVPAEDSAEACFGRHSNLAQLVGVTRRWLCNISSSWLTEVVPALDLALFDHHTATLNSL